MHEQRLYEVELLPWHGVLWGQLQLARRNGKIPHALLFSGPEGLGKHRLAWLFAHSLLCRSPDKEGTPCGQCRGCHLFLAGNHGDFKWVEPEKTSKSGEIKIDAIREIKAADYLTTQAGGYKIVIITPADRLNPAAANSLLKTLEEPSSHSLIVLISSQPTKLKATIRSRCQAVNFRLPPARQVHDWLAQRIVPDQVGLVMGLSGGVPLLARDLAAPRILAERSEVFERFLSIIKDQQDPVAIVEDWLKLDFQRLLIWISGWLIDMLRLQTGEEPPCLFNPDQRRPLRDLAQKLDPRVLHELLQDTFEAQRSVTTNLSPQLVLEKLLIGWSEMARE